MSRDLLAGVRDHLPKADLILCETTDLDRFPGDGVVMALFPGDLRIVGEVSSQNVVDV